jgi:hypothetical protein
MVWSASDIGGVAAATGSWHRSSSRWRGPGPSHACLGQFDATYDRINEWVYSTYEFDN